MDQFAEEITGDQLREWEAYWELEPFGDEWRAFARQTVVLARVGGCKSDSLFEEMLLPGFNPLERKQSAEEMRAIVERIKAKNGG